VEELVKAKKADALVLMTVYSPFMWAVRMAEPGVLAMHMQEDPGAVAKGLAIMTENVIDLLKGCMRVGVDGFYVSTQGGEANRFPDHSIFNQYIKPTDLAVWDAIKDRTFNILHVCDYNGPYDDLAPYLDYPGHVVNSSLVVGGRTMAPKEAARLFGRPFMGGLERKAELSTGKPAEVRRAAETVLAQAPDQFILGADCTVLADTPWENLKTAVDTAHHYRSGK
jgi:uroporphyrinogen decarboxylase